MRRYVIASSKMVHPNQLGQLRRAFARAADRGAHTVERVHVWSRAGRFVVVMDGVPASHGPEECEHLFSTAWYDAFGPRPSRHVGRLVECGPGHELEITTAA